jgi:hypothetical protein
LHYTTTKDYTMKFTSSFDIWSVPVDLLKHAQPGQWVYAGNKADKGRFLGVKASGTVVVAWHGNTKSRTDKAGYIKALRSYAKA